MYDKITNWLFDAINANLNPLKNNMNISMVISVGLWIWFLYLHRFPFNWILCIVPLCSYHLRGFIPIVLYNLFPQSFVESDYLIISWIAVVYVNLLVLRITLNNIYPVLKKKFN